MSIIERDRYTSVLSTTVIQPEPSMSSIRSLLLEGADPFKPMDRGKSAMDIAIEKYDLSLIALLLAGARTTSKIHIQKLIEASGSYAPKTVSLHSNKEGFTAFDETITIPHDKVTIKTRFVSSQFRKIAQECVDRIYTDTNPFVQPISGYLDKTVRETHPQVLRFVPQKNEAELGYFNPKTKDIILGVVQDDNINASIKNGKISTDAFYSTYVHENYHAMLDATVLSDNEGFNDRINFAAERDSRDLNKQHWNCDTLFRDHLTAVEYAYPESQQAGEYIVRVPEIIVQLQQKHKCTWQEAAAQVKKAIPRLYKLVEEEVLPQFKAKFKETIWSIS
jgi:hypothetical protein